MSASSNLSELEVCENGSRYVKLLPSTNDNHGGIIVDLQEQIDSKTFLNLLRASILEWKQQGKRGVWIKLPIGLASLVETAVKIDAEFLEVLAFRQSHNAFFGRSDLFFICMLRPLSFELQKQEQEIDAVQWMPFEEYAAQPFAQKHDLFRYITELCF